MLADLNRVQGIVSTAAAPVLAGVNGRITGKEIVADLLEKYPAAPRAGMLAEVEVALQTVRPHLQADGGDVELVGVDDEGVSPGGWLALAAAAPCHS